MTPQALDQSAAADALTAAAERQLAAGDLHGAFAGLKAALRLTPDHPAATGAMGLFLADHGDPGAAAHLLSRALELAGGDGPEVDRLAPALARLLATLWPDAWHARLDADLRACLASPAVTAQSLARVTARTLLLKYPTFDDGVPALTAMGEDPLWRAFLTQCLNVDPEMEQRLNVLRAAVWAREEAQEGGATHTLACALGLAGFAAEYVAVPPPGAEDATGLAAAMFGPLSPAEAAATRDAGPLAALLVRRTVDEPALERSLGPTLERLTPPSEDTVSAEVRAQYEANPYPRWTLPPAPAPRPLRAGIEAQPGLDRRAFGDAWRRVLIAGCGTGFEPIDLARMDPTLDITAMDLSRASLAYGARVAADQGLDRVRFTQGDILALDRIDARFDVVVSTGVIHHMAEPAAGLSRLVGVLRPGGVLRLALYSDRARDLVKLAHALIREKGWRAVPEDIRAFRAHVLALPETAPLAGLRYSDDFYSLSGCRDLVFHVHEHRYTPLGVGELLASAGLRLIGFEAPPEAAARFRETFGAADPLDLALWDRLEQRHPTLFAGMYQFWAQS
jgi:SAM-dependent methyltransferase